MAQQHHRNILSQHFQQSSCSTKEVALRSGTSLPTFCSRARTILSPLFVFYREYHWGEPHRCLGACSRNQQVVIVLNRQRSAYSFKLHSSYTVLRHSVHAIHSFDLDCMHRFGLDACNSSGVPVTSRKCYPAAARDSRVAHA